MKLKHLGKPGIPGNGGHTKHDATVASVTDHSHAFCCLHLNVMLVTTAG